MNYIAWLLLAVILLLSLFQSQGLYLLNDYSLHVVKASVSLEVELAVDDQIDNLQNSSINCHLGWLDLIYKYNNNYKIIKPIYRKLIACSSLHMGMIHKIAPLDSDLASIAIQLYPENVLPLYWLIQSTDPKITEKSKCLVEEILMINPKESLAWRYLGIIYLREQNFEEALNAHKNNCYYGDSGSNGCLTAGVLLEKQGKLDEALFFYRLSGRQLAKEAIDRLEDESLP